MSSSASTDTFPVDDTLKMQRAADEPAPQWWRLNGQATLSADVAEVRRASGITIACALCGGGVALGAWAACGGAR